MSRNGIFWMMIVSAAVGFLVSAYLTYLSLIPPTSCPIGDFGFFSCNEVIWSVYAKFYGVSVALLGLCWFVVAFGLILLTQWSWRFIRGVVAWSILGAIGVAGFLYTEVFLLGSICPLCTVAHVAGIMILALSFLGMQHYTASTES